MKYTLRQPIHAWNISEVGTTGSYAGSVLEGTKVFIEGDVEVGKPGTWVIVSLEGRVLKPKPGDYWVNDGISGHLVPKEEFEKLYKSMTVLETVNSENFENHEFLSLLPSEDRTALIRLNKVLRSEGWKMTINLDRIK